MSKYAPANDKGEKPYVIVQSGWGRHRVKIAYGKTLTDAKWRAFGRQGTGEYIVHGECRRATPEDMEQINDR